MSEMENKPLKPPDMEGQSGETEKSRAGTPPAGAVEKPNKPVETPDKTILGFKGNVFYLGVVSLLNDVASEIIYPLAPLFLFTVFGAAYAVFIGVIEGIAEGTASLMKLLSGWYSDKVKRKKVFVFVGYAFSVLMRPLIGFTHFIRIWWYVLAVRFSDRMGKGIRTAPRDALIANSINEKERGKSFGFHRAMDHFGAVLGALIAFGLVSLFGIKEWSSLWWIFLFAFIPGFLSLYFVVKKVSDTGIKAHTKETETGELKPTAKLTLKGFDSRFKLFLLITALFTLGNSTDAFLILRVANIEEIGFKVTLVWAVFHIIKAAFSTPAGLISDYVGRKGVIVAGWLVYAVVYFGFAFTRSANAAWILFIFYGVYYALTEGVAKALVADFAPEELRGTAFGWYHFVVGIAIIPASIIFGALWYAFGSPVVSFCFGAALALGAVVLLVLFVPEKPEPKAETEGEQPTELVFKPETQRKLFGEDVEETEVEFEPDMNDEGLDSTDDSLG